ncbi:DMT family transporter [Paracoccus aminophilus]|uniref:ABC transporter, membrane spanning protein n=1 Tax=Paracoccus aminophilus JCM 7686 TaxID=1367847 RepID=S5XQI0_PARAH|nr:DMT family transporter [Paracoccus aminophilus]AGT07317.1 ABC transporter, membrane spanning protein [Paracoccus aminophilus JCM 7686]
MAETQTAQISTSRPMSGAEWAMLATLAAIWGCSFLFNALAIPDLPILLIVTLRVGLAAAALLAFMALSGQRLPKGRAVWTAFFTMGLFNNALPFSLIVAGQQHIPAGVASILNATTPLFTVLFAHVLTADERLNPGKVAGVAIGFLGVAAMIGGDAVRALGSDLIAQLCCLGAAVSYAGAAIYGRRFRRMGVTPMATAAGSLFGASVLLTPVMLVIDQPWSPPAPGLTAVLAVLGLALISTAFAYVLYYRILATAGAVNVGLVTFLVPACAILLGIVVLGEHLAPRHVLGMVLIGMGLAAIDGRLLRRFTAWRMS